MAKLRLERRPDGAYDLEVKIQAKGAVPFYAFSPGLAPYDIAAEVKRIGNVLREARVTTRMAWAHASKPKTEEEN
jgi:hypothetical protein